MKTERKNMRGKRRLLWTHPAYKRNWFQNICLNIYARFLKVETGLATAEYAIVAIAAVTLAGILIAIIKSDAIKTALESILKQAFQIPA